MTDIQQDIARQTIIDIAAEADLNIERFASYATNGHDPIVRAITAAYRRGAKDAAKALDELKRENFMLAAGQCIVSKGLRGDDHGNQYCALEHERDELRERLAAAQSVIDELHDDAEKHLQKRDELGTALAYLVVACEESKWPITADQMMPLANARAVMAKTHG